MSGGALPRLAAALIAAAAWAGLAVDFAATDRRWDSPVLALWAMLRYFTITTNLAVALAFTALAAGLSPRAVPRVLAALSLSILLVGIVFRLLLEGVYTHGLGLGDVLLHRVTPIAVPLFWLAFVPKGRLRAADPLLWLLYPLAYLAYALARGGLDGRYPYPFLDLPAIGPERVAINAAVIGAGFLATGFFCVWVDRMMGARA
ncbi:MAG: Pr6Pr family membrane protein [Caulobacteraceae bacterium]|nr:Pr6Pr family membrane protein [Caulobacter sp.]